MRLSLWDFDQHGLNLNKTLRGEALRTQSVSFVANEDRGRGEDRSRKDETGIADRIETAESDV